LAVEAALVRLRRVSGTSSGDEPTRHNTSHHREAVMLYVRITYGYVRQHFDSATGDCVQQEFVADETQPVIRMDEDGNPIPESEIIELANTEKECAPDMVQP
jgi:hypothetical protein